MQWEFVLQWCAMSRGNRRLMGHIAHLNNNSHHDNEIRFMESHTNYLDIVVKQIRHKKIFKFSPEFLMLNIKPRM